MGITSNSSNKKDLNVELNLLPVFDVLSVCICFLLMTVVWVEVRALETKQSLGSQSPSETTQGSSLWISIDEKNNLTLTLKQKNKKDQNETINSKSGQIDFEKLKSKFSFAVQFKVTSTQILPSQNTAYEQIIHVMDLSKQAGINNIGLSPI